MTSRTNSTGSSRWRVGGFVVAALLMMFGGALGSSAIAQDSDVVAAGLNGPQGLLIGPDGDLWIIEAGLGGDEAIEVLNTETGERVAATIGESARVVRVDLTTGEQTTVVSLPSIRHDGGAQGGARLALHDGRIYASVGEWADPDVEAPDAMATIVAIDEAGAVVEVADTWQYELDNDPYGGGTSHSHPFGMASIDGSLWVADAGANAIFSVDTTSGEIATAALFEPLPGVFPRADYGGEMLTDPVPTALALGGDGRTYVSLLSGAPFVPGSAKVMVINDDGTVTDHALGLTMLTDLATGPDGNLYATQFAIFGEQGPQPNSGAVVRVSMDGTTEVVAEGLPFVTAVDVASNGDIFVAVNGVGAPGSGEVIKLAGVAAASDSAPSQLPTTGATDVAVIMIIAAVTTILGGFLVLRTARAAI